MPKLKTHKGASKRFKKTGTGKVVRGHAFARHILTSKSRKRKRSCTRVWWPIRPISLVAANASLLDFIDRADGARGTCPDRRY